MCPGHLQAGTHELRTVSVKQVLWFGPVMACPHHLRSGGTTAAHSWGPSSPPPSCKFHFENIWNTKKGLQILLTCFPLALFCEVIQKCLPVALVQDFTPKCKTEWFCILCVCVREKEREREGERNSVSQLPLYPLHVLFRTEEEDSAQCSLQLWQQGRNTRLCLLKNVRQGFPSGAVVENLPANAGDTGSSPGLGRSHKPRSN